MKRNLFITLVFSLFILILPACHEDEWIDWKLKNEQWLEANKSKPGVITTESGLQYKVLYQGWYLNSKPSVNSVVKVNYSGSLINGTSFDSGTNAYFYMSNVIAGWREGIAKMNEGGSYILYVPSSLGYDDATTNPSIPPYSTLIFTVDLQNY